MALSPKHKSQDIVERRAQVASFRLAGIRNQRQIAAKLGVNASTINRDFKALDEEWRDRARADIDTEKGLDLDRTERLIQALWAEAIKGRWLATDRVLNLMQHRAKLMGLEAPKRSDVNISIEVRTIAEKLAEDMGMDAADLIAEAEAIAAGAWVDSK